MNAVDPWVSVCTWNQLVNGKRIVPIISIELISAKNFASSIMIMIAINRLTVQSTN